MELGKEPFWVAAPATMKHTENVAPISSCLCKGKVERVGAEGTLDPSTQPGIVFPRPGTRKGTHGGARMAGGLQN